MRVPGLVLILLLAACADPETGAPAAGDPAGGSEPLPAPQGGRGGVTGMPEPGEPGPRGITLSGDADEAEVEALFELEEGAGLDGEGLPPSDGTAIIIGGDGDAQ